MKWIGLLGIVCIVLSGYFFLKPTELYLYQFDQVMDIQGEAILYSRITNTEDHIRGLSGHPPLEKNQALVFDFGEEGMRGIWMKDMLFAIDVVWLNASSTIVFIRENFTPESYPEVVRPTQSARYVVEFPSGFVSRTKLKIGDSLIFEK